MAKITIIEASRDPLRAALGKGKVVQQYGNGNSRITTDPSKQFNVKVEETTRLHNGKLFRDTTKLIITPAVNSNQFENALRNAVSLGTTFTDHFMTSPEIQRKSEQLKDPLSSSPSMYEIKTNFNYLANDYDAMIATAPNLSICPTSEAKTKHDYLKFKEELLAMPINLSTDISRYKNFVERNIGPDQRKDLTSDHILEQVPYWNQISIINEVNNSFSDFLIGLGSFDDLLLGYLNANKRTIKFNVQEKEEVTETPIPVFPLLDWISSPAYLTDDYFPLVDKGDKTSFMTTLIYKLLMAGYVRSLSAGNYRSYEQILRGERCYVEDFVYQIDKYLEEIVEPKVQSFYIPAVVDICRKSDTQIKYGKKYFYKGKGHRLVVGNQYYYNQLRFYNKGTDEQYATLSVVNEPSAVILPNDMFVEAVQTLMPPPMFPQVKFVTENNSSKQIQIYLSPTKGELIDDFITIIPSDLQQQEQMKLNSITQSDGKTKFEYYPQKGMFEIFKCEDAPKSYDDFKNKRVTDIAMPFSSDTAVYHDALKPNKKYYYLFRKMNEKRLVSNPTAIYEVELIIDADDSKIMVQEYKFPEEPKSQESKKFKQLFQIYPAQDQSWFDQGQPLLDSRASLRGTIDNLRLGTADKLIWGKKFKIRIKSTTSGKIIDYNVTFKLTKNKTQEDF